MLSKEQGSDRQRRVTILALLLVVLWTLLNAVKPPVVDDPAYLAMARQIARAPCDPYGFQQFWYQNPMPALHVLAPPVLPYWLGLGMRLFGEETWLLKLWLFPIAWLFVASLRALLDRFARGVTAPVLLACVASPAFLPSLNFMLDVPALALGMAALVVFLKGCDRERLSLAILAGVIAGLAAQTKYSLLLMPCVLFVAGVLRGRWSLGILAALGAGVVFGGWELLIWSKYGESHFAFHSSQALDGPTSKFELAGTVIPLLGGIASFLAVVGCSALGMRRRGLLVVGGILLGGYATFAWLPLPSQSLWKTIRPQPLGGASYTLFASSGTVVVVVVLSVMFRLLLRNPPAELSGRTARRLRGNRDVLFLVSWLGLEMLGYLVMSPFVATRRLLTMTVVATLMIGRFASRRRPRLDWIALVPGVVLGLLFAIIDVYDARLHPESVRLAAAAIHQHDSNANIWFAGHWGFQYAAERRGMKPVSPGESQLQAGDWLLLPDVWLPQQRFSRPPDEDLVHFVSLRSACPLRTLPPYYGGYFPMDRWNEPRVEVRVYRIRRDWSP